MFYSKTILAKKAPLGTVWIAAHLERRIKKSQIDGIDIPSYAHEIMFPVVPIALRLSAHLLFGIVRIFSLKVNYLLQDCNSFKSTIRMVVPAARIDLPADADRAPFELLTKPDTFQLDAFEFDDIVSGHDDHVKTYRQITMNDGTLDEEDPYVAFHLADDAEPLNLEVMPPFDTEMLKVLDVPPRENVNDSGPGNEVLPPQDLPEMEIMRDAVHEFEQFNRLDSGDTNNGNDGIDILLDPNRQGEGSSSPVTRLRTDLGKESVPSLVHSNASNAPSPYDPDIPSTEISIGQCLPNFELRPSPLAEKKIPKRRKKRQFFDESLVLSNADMREQLEDTSKIVFKRRKLPCTALDSWRLQKAPKIECILHKPLLSGMCASLLEVFERRYPLSRIHPAPSKPFPDPLNQDHEMPDRDTEIEQPRFVNETDAILSGQVASPLEREENILPPVAENLASPSDIEAISVPKMSLMFKKHASADPFGLEPETPSVNLDTMQYMDDSAFPEFPSLLNSGDMDDFNFLEASNDASSGFGESEVGTMSARTRAVAQYFKEISPVSEGLEIQRENISLEKILTGKRRKQCAQMFFETLVLKSNDFIDVNQEEAYGDILISPTPALAEAKF